MSGLLHNSSNKNLPASIVVLLKMVKLPITCILLLLSLTPGRVLAKIECEALQAHTDDSACSSCLNSCSGFSQCCTGSGCFCEEECSSTVYTGDCSRWEGSTEWFYDIYTHCWDTPTTVECYTSGGCCPVECDHYGSSNECKECYLDFCPQATLADPPEPPTETPTEEPFYYDPEPEDPEPEDEYAFDPGTAAILFPGGLVAMLVLIFSFL